MDRNQTTDAIARHDESEARAEVADRERERHGPPPVVTGATAARLLVLAATHVGSVRAQERIRKQVEGNIPAEEKRLITRTDEAELTRRIAMTELERELAIACEDNDWVKQWTIRTASKLMDSLKAVEEPVGRRL